MLAESSSIQSVMQFTTLLVAVAFLATVSSFPNSVENFQWSNELKASLHPQKVESIQNFFNRAQNSGFRPNNKMHIKAADKEMTEMECINYHVDNLSKINNKNKAEVVTCVQNYLNASEALENATMLVKTDNDKALIQLSQKLTSCERVKDAQKGLQCHVDLKPLVDSFLSLITQSKKTLDEYEQIKLKSGFDKTWCINDSVAQADKNINVEHEQLVLC